MKVAFVLGGAVGFVLGARAGRERYEAIVSAVRRVAGSQTVQSTAGVLQARVDAITQQTRELVGGHLPGPTATGDAARHSANGERP